MKILIFCSDGPHNKYLISKICKEFNHVKIFVESGQDQLKWKLKKKKYKQYCQLKYQMIRRMICGSNRFRKQYFAQYLDDFLYENYDTTFVDNINDKSVVKGIHDYKPDIGIVMGTGIMHKEVLQAMQTIHIINIHGGYLPYYKGNHCFFFAYYNKEYDKIGSTIHFINSGIDAGDIIERVTPEILQKDTPESLYCKAEKMAVDRLVLMLKEYENGKNLPGHKQDLPGKVYYTKDRKLRYDINLFIRRLIGGK